MLQINYTLFIQIANFLVLLYLLNLLLFRPIRRIISRRNEEISSLESAVEDFQDRSSRNEEGIQEGMVQARKEGYGEAERLKSEGQVEERKLLQEAGSQAEGKIGAAKTEIETKMTDVRKALEDQVAAFSKEFSEKILGRSVQ